MRYLILPSDRSPRIRSRVGTIAKSSVSYLTRVFLGRLGRNGITSISSSISPLGGVFGLSSVNRGIRSPAILLAILFRSIPHLPNKNPLQFFKSEEVPASLRLKAPNLPLLYKPVPFSTNLILPSPSHIGIPLNTSDKFLLYSRSADYGRRDSFPLEVSSPGRED